MAVQFNKKLYSYPNDISEHLGRSWSNTFVLFDG